MSTKRPCMELVPRALAIGAALFAAPACATTEPSAMRAEASSVEMSALLREKGCHACHAMSETLLGPSYQAIATMHGARAEVMTDVLAEKIIVGGAGNWGVVPMVRNDRVDPDEARAMAAWILAQTPS